LIRGFQRTNPQTEVQYITASSTEIMTAIIAEKQKFDLVVSSAMDLQTKLANDGFAVPFVSTATDLVPDWGKWRDSVFAFTQEPATLVLSVDAFAGRALPKSRQELLDILRENPDEFAGRVGTYDVRASGLGYLFATQDSRISETFWRMSEVFGALGVKLYCCSSDMIDDVSTGRIAVAYNALGSYARARDDLADRIHIVEPEDFTTVMLRSVVMLNADSLPAERFLDHLLTQAWSPAAATEFPFPNPTPETDPDVSKFRPIRLGPGLLVFLDRFKRAQFLEAWEDAVLQK
jgi:iron(III) transport system substrate-binding protein